MKIRRLKIKKYRIFENIEFDFTNKNGKALDTVVLAGINGTGKTTLLYLISKILFSRDISNNELSIEIEFNEQEKQLFLDHVIFDSFYDSFYDPMRGRFFTLSRESFFTDVEQVFKKDSFTFKNSIINEKNSILLLKVIIDFLNLKNNFKIAYFHNNIFPSTSSIDKKNISKVLNFINYNNFEKDFEVYFQEVIHDYLEKNRNFTFNEVVKKRITEINNIIEKLNVNTKIYDIKGKKIIFKNFTNKKLNINSLSDGEKQIYIRAIFLNSLKLKNGILFVDEPELSLHPTWQSSVTNLYTNAGENNQTFIATHSPHVISATKSENLFCLYANNETKKIEVINIAKTGHHTLGAEPNRILSNNYANSIKKF